MGAKIVSNLMCQFEDVYMCRLKTASIQRKKDKDDNLQIFRYAHLHIYFPIFAA